MKNYILSLLLITSLLANGYLAIQWRLGYEHNAQAGYLIDIATAKSKIEPGMTLDEIIARVHHDPDLIGVNEKGKLCSWSAAYHYGPLQRFLGYQRENGHYYLDVQFDSQGKVLEVSLSEA